MPTDELQDRPGFNELLAELSDSDVVIEVAASSSAQRMPDSAPVRRLEEAVEATYRALAGGKEIRLETVAVLEEVGRHSLSLWLRVAKDRAQAQGGNESLLK